MKGYDKKTLLIGIAFIAAAFLCVVAVFYLSVSNQQAKAREIKALQEELLAASTEKDLAQKEADYLKEKVGQTIYLEKLLKESEGFYGDEEKKRREGFLWIDRKNNTLLVTLGALNGLSTGTRLTVFDGDNQAGYVRVSTPMDVISYVYPVAGQDVFDKNYYRVVFE